MRNNAVPTNSKNPQRRAGLFSLSVASMLLALSMNAHAAAGDRLDKVRLIGPANAKGLDAYTLQEVGRVFHEHLNTPVQEQEAGDELARQNTIVIGTAENNPVIAQLIKDGFVEPESRMEGYSLTCGPHPQDAKSWLLVVAGVDSRGALYGLRDLEHYEMHRFSEKDGQLNAESFLRRDYPRIEYRGHWVWGCNMPDKKAWMENMSRWKLNELIHWDNYPPKKAKEYVDFAHTRGIRVIWAFGWGWEPSWNYTLPKEFDRGVGKGVHMCGSSAFNRAFFQREILRKVREDYVPSGCDGIYFQSFTEVPKCECPDCKTKSKGEIMLQFVNPLVDAIKKEFPDLWISCGVHANYGTYDELKKLDPRCNLLWENCPSGTSIRGADEDFGYINKNLPYSHGFSKTCPADPEYTEDSLTAWMNGNAHRYTLTGDIEKYVSYMRWLQGWAQKMLGKPSTNKHATTVACHSVFCRRTPYMHVAFAEALWNPGLDTEETVGGIVEYLKANGGLPGFEGPSVRKALEATTSVQHDAIGKTVALATPPSPKYDKGGVHALTDGKQAASVECANRNWLGFEKQNLDAVVDLGAPTSVNVLAAGFLHYPRAGVHLPTEVEFAVSQDGTTFNVVKVVKAPAVNEDVRKVYRVDGLDLYKVRYLRVRAKNHKHWLFVDEIMVNPLHAD